MALLKKEPMLVDETLSAQMQETAARIRARAEIFPEIGKPGQELGKATVAGYEMMAPLEGPTRGGSGRSGVRPTMKFVDLTFQVDVQQSLAYSEPALPSLRNIYADEQSFVRDACEGVLTSSPP